MRVGSPMSGHFLSSKWHCTCAIVLVLMLILYTNRRIFGDEENKDFLQKFSAGRSAVNTLRRLLSIKQVAFQRPWHWKVPCGPWMRSWLLTQKVLKEVPKFVAPHRDYRYYSNMASFVEEMGDHYERLQDYECRVLKDMLLQIEDKNDSVRLADFYNASLYEGKQRGIPPEAGCNLRFGSKESTYCRSYYVNGPANCVASSSDYSVSSGPLWMPRYQIIGDMQRYAYVFLVGATCSDATA